MAKVFNPIYDTVFKYLMEDKRVAKVLLGGILSKNIVDVEIKSHEHAENESGKLKLQYVEFVVNIKNPQGSYNTYTIEVRDLDKKEFQNLPSEVIFEQFMQTKKIEQQLATAINMLSSAGISQDQIAEQLNIPIDEVKQVLKTK